MENVNSITFDISEIDDRAETYTIAGTQIDEEPLILGNLTTKNTEIYTENTM